MKSVELRRHTDNDRDRLTQDGVRQARQIASRLSPPYALYVSTGAQRATQTLEVWQEEVGADFPIQDEIGLRSEHEDRWKEVYEQAGSNELARMQQVDRKFVQDEAGVLATALRSVFERLPESGSALVCGHSPTNEAAVLGLTGQLIHPMSKGAGVRVVQEGERYRVEPLD